MRQIAAPGVAVSRCYDPQAVHPSPHDAERLEGISLELGATLSLLKFDRALTATVTVARGDSASMISARACKSSITSSFYIVMRPETGCCSTLAGDGNLSEAKQVN